MSRWTSVFDLCDIVRETGFAIHSYLRNGHLEKVYQKALVHRLQKQGILVVPNPPLTVQDEDGTVLGEFFADLFIENILIVELKAVRAVVDDHTTPLLGYLRCSRMTWSTGELGAPRFYTKKYVLSDALL